MGAASHPIRVCAATAWSSGVFCSTRLLPWARIILATGHYARKRVTADGRQELLRAVDHSKDQTYVLHVLTQARLERAIFPVGGYPKSEIRLLAQTLDCLPLNAADSQDLCFLAGEDYRDFIRRNAPQIARPGPILTRLGKVVGEHQGLAYYTIGQRKGLGVPSPVPLYVLAKDAATNTLIVGVEAELGARTLTAQAVNWIAGEAPSETVACSRSRHVTRPGRPGRRCTPLDGNRVEVLVRRAAARYYRRSGRRILRWRGRSWWWVDRITWIGKMLCPHVRISAHSPIML